VVGLMSRGRGIIQQPCLPEVGIGPFVCVWMWNGDPQDAPSPEPPTTTFLGYGTTGLVLWGNFVIRMPPLLLLNLAGCPSLIRPSQTGSVGESYRIQSRRGLHHNHSSELPGDAFKPPVPFRQNR
jgi:hypothetical protein